MRSAKLRREELLVVAVAAAAPESTAVSQPSWQMRKAALRTDDNRPLVAVTVVIMILRIRSGVLPLAPQRHRLLFWFTYYLGSYRYRTYPPQKQTSCSSRYLSSLSSDINPC